MPATTIAVVKTSSTARTAFFDDGVAGRFSFSEGVPSSLSIGSESLLSSDAERQGAGSREPDDKLPSPPLRKGVVEIESEVTEEEEDTVVVTMADDNGTGAVDWLPLIGEQLGSTGDNNGEI